MSKLAQNHSRVGLIADGTLRTDAQWRDVNCYSTRQVEPGYCIFEQIEPRFPEKSKHANVNGKATSILLPDQAARGNYDHSDTIYGRVIQCGVRADRTTCRPFPDELQHGHPLCEGTFIVCRRASLHKVSPNEDGINTWDIISHDTKRPEWAPEA